MDAVAFAILGIHFSLLGVLSIYGLHRLYLVARWWRHREKRPAPPQALRTLPVITVQVPLYNEPQVARRIIDAVAALDYPSEKLQIQILDDSTDHTVDIVASAVERHRDDGIDIQHLQRAEREGFKAGALRCGMEKARGDYVAVFDADFVPAPHVLREAIHHFSDPQVGMVQMRWEHLNRESSALTQVQAMRLDAHFGIEQAGRAAAGLHFNFNGTAGIWRAAAIETAGGWQHDTLTEDLDLSYRAQHRGWRFVYLPNLDCPAELPEDFSALRSQQHRWAKGATQVLLKLSGAIWSSGQSLSQKLEASFHLSANFAYLAMVIDTTLFLVPSLIVRDHYQIRDTLWVDLPLFFLSSGSHMVFFLAGQRAVGRSARSSLAFVPALIAVGIGLAINDARAVLEALRRKATGFVRTPKRGKGVVPAMASDTIRLRDRLSRAAPEWFLAGFFALALVWAAYRAMWPALPFLLALQSGFLSAALLISAEHASESPETPALPSPSK